MRFVMGPVLVHHPDVHRRLRHGHRQGGGLQIHPRVFSPSDVGAVGGLVGLLGALGGFFLPLFFAYAYKATGIPRPPSPFCFLITIASFAWLHWVVWHLLHEATPQLKNQFDSMKVNA